MIPRAAALAGLMLTAAACGHAIFVPPRGPGTPTDASTAWADATTVCRSAQSYAADLRVSGRAAGQRIWRLSLETAVTPTNIYMGATVAGQPIFILAGASSEATLWLRREHRVVRAPAGEIIEAILGVAIPPDRLFALLSGCGTRSFDVTSSSSYSGLLAVQTRDARVFLQRAGSVWKTYGAEVEGFRVQFSWKSGMTPEKLWIRSTPGRDPEASLDVTVRDAGLNDQVQASVFNPPVGAAGASPMTLEELRSGAWRKQP